MASHKLNPKVIRIGDRVRLIDPRRIIKVGYELDIDKLQEEVRNDDAVLEFCESQRLRPKDVERVTRAIAACRLSERMRSGARRSIYWSEEFSELAGKVFTASSKHTVFTGEYQRDHYTIRYDEYDGPYLGHSQAHVLLELQIPLEYNVHNIIDSSNNNIYDYGFYVDRAQVQKLIAKEEGE